MARETVYEGPDLQQLLQRVIDERGPARIRPPERRRKGGLFGFFAKEVYVITVDETAPASASGTAAAPSAAGTGAPSPLAASLDAESVLRGELAASGSAGGPAAPSSALVDAMNHARAATAGSPGAAGTLAAASTSDTAAASLHGAGTADDPWAAESSARVSALSSRRGAVTSPLRALVEATEDEADLSTSASNGGSNGAGPNGLSNARSGGSVPSRGNAAGIPATVSRSESPLRDLVDDGQQAETARPASPGPEPHKPFREVLSEVASSLGEEPGAYRPDPEKLQPLRRSAVVRPLDLADVPRASGTSDAPTTASRGRAPGERIQAQLSLVSLDERVPAAAGAAAALAAPALEEQAFEELALEEQALQERPAPAAEEPALDTSVEASADAPPDLDATIVDLLRAAGFPDELLPNGALDSDRPLLEAVFASLPAPPPLPADPGGLVAVVGAAGMVRPMAEAIALAVGCPEDEVVVASPSASDRHARAECRARNATQASALHPGWRRDKVAVVAVYAPPMGTTQGWTREVLHALRPSCVWGMAGATTKPDDVRRWVGAIGGVDALVVTDVEATATPASILSLGIPIACLDEEPATPERWAAVVADLVARH